MQKTIALLSTLVRNTSSVAYNKKMGNETIENILNALKTYLKPSIFAEEWDNVGLLLEAKRKEDNVIQKILLCNDLTLPVVDEAVKNTIDLIIAYHPPIFQAVKSLTYDNWKQEIMIRCIANGISIYSPHTSLDAVPGGINDAFVDLFDNCRHGPFNQILKKVEAFNPIVKEKPEGSLLGATFYATGTTSHMGVLCKTLLDSENKDFCFRIDSDYGYLGKPSPHTNQVKISGICINPNLKGTEAEFPRMVKGIFPSLAPYSEGVMFLEPSKWFVPGAGRLIHLSQQLTLKEVLYHVQMGLDLKNSQYADAGGPISTIAVCVGSGGSFFGGKRVADLIITGEMSHHQILDCTQQGMSLILLGHCNSERHYLKTFAATLKVVLGGKDSHTPEIIISAADTPPLKVSWCNERSEFPAVFTV